MRRRLGYVGVWLVATLATGWVAWAAVGFVDDQVSDAPAAPLSSAEVGALPLATTAPSSDDGPAPTGSAASSSSTTPSSTVTSAPATSSSTVPVTSLPDSTVTSTGPSTTSTTQPRSSSTTSTSTTTTTTPATTTTAPDPTTEVYNTEGGTVSIAWVPGQVWLLWVSPATNWTYDIEEGGPPKVEVEFKMEDRKIKFKAEWENGELKVKIQEDEE